MSRVVDQQIIVLEKLLAQFVELVDDVVPGRVFQQMNLVSVLVLKHLRYGARVEQCGFQLRQPLVIIDANYDRVVVAKRDIRNVTFACHGYDVFRLVTLRVEGSNTHIVPSEFHLNVC